MGIRQRLRLDRVIPAQTLDRLHISAWENVPVFKPPAPIVEEQTHRRIGGFPFWPMIETVDISLVDGIPTVLQVLQAILPNFEISEIFMAQEFLKVNTSDICQAFAKAIAHIPLRYEAHVELKQRVPGAIGLIRTGDTIQYANMILVSGQTLQTSASN